MFGAAHDADGYIDSEGKYVIKNCFVKGTLVSTITGMKPIEEIQVGETVLSYNESNGKNEYKKVLKTFVSEASVIFTVFVGQEKIETTWNHPFYVKEKGWVQTKDLKQGDKLMNSKGELLLSLAKIQNQV